MKKTNKWQIWCRPFERNYARFDGQGWHVFDFGIIKIHTMPEEGEMIGKRNYYGFTIRFSYWFPIDRAY